MKGSKWFVMGIFVIFAGSIMLLQPGLVQAFNPQPEPPGKPNPDGTKQGIIIDDKQTKSTKQKGVLTPGSSKMGIAIEERVTPPGAVQGTAK